MKFIYKKKEKQMHTISNVSHVLFDKKEILVVLEDRKKRKLDIDEIKWFQIFQGDKL